ncbi:hypothetical protein HDU93_000688 [Gonapodya sp. JEL0774]|nr:hypothetical protein HDU93_000688 [Gonapodya sp. JEL0774]
MSSQDIAYGAYIIGCPELLQIFHEVQLATGEWVWAGIRTFVGVDVEEVVATDSAFKQAIEETISDPESRYPTNRSRLRYAVSKLSVQYRALDIDSSFDERIAFVREVARFAHSERVPEFCVIGESYHSWGMTRSAVEWVAPLLAYSKDPMDSVTSLVVIGDKSVKSLDEYKFLQQLLSGFPCARHLEGDSFFPLEIYPASAVEFVQRAVTLVRRQIVTKLIGIEGWTSREYPFDGSAAFRGLMCAPHAYPNLRELGTLNIQNWIPPHWISKPSRTKEQSANKPWPRVPHLWGIRVLRIRIRELDIASGRYPTSLFVRLLNMLIDSMENLSTLAVSIDFLEVPSKLSPSLEVQWGPLVEHYDSQSTDIVKSQDDIVHREVDADEEEDVVHEGLGYESNHSKQCSVTCALGIFLTQLLHSHHACQRNLVFEFFGRYTVSDIRKRTDREWWPDSLKEWDGRSNVKLRRGRVIG